MLHVAERILMIVQEAFERFIMKKKLKNLAPKTISNYMCFVSPFIKHVGNSLDVCFSWHYI